MFEKFGKTIDEFMQTLDSRTTTTWIDAKTVNVSAPYPDAARPSLRLDLAVGRTDVRPGQAMLIEGTVTYDIAEWAPVVQTEGDHVTVKQDIGLHLIGAWHQLCNDWLLSLGTTKPFALFLSKGAGEVTMALGGVPLTSTQVDIGAGKGRFSFDKANPVECGAITVNIGAGNLIADGLLNANTERLVVSGGASETTLNFTGAQIHRPMTVSLHTGAGKISLNVKRGLPCQVVVKKILGTVHMQGNFSAIQPQVYETSGYLIATEPTLKIQIETPVADVVLNQVD